MARRLAGVLVVLVVLAVACGPTVGDSGDAASDAGSSDGGAGTRGDASASATDTGGAADVTTAADFGEDSTGAAGVPCQGETCLPGEFCDFAKATCGGPSDPPDQANCRPLPDTCDEIYAPVCGCDGEVHSNACVAAAAGVDTWASPACEPPPGMFPCGDEFCVVGSVCVFLWNDISTVPHEYRCDPLPAACGGVPSCECIDATGICVSPGCELLEGGHVRINC